uniref:Uncharacterized protein n=1 Tax=Raoultella ornithinolytica TaxID=54291 RepID=A0A1V0M3B6_RAOOR|nr:Hypothetical protein [Raoultella ornithinolytica]URQ56698.1 Hypothetical protein [Raoultella planticola]URZ94369.1 Hypothetical protein [Raoultella ornithinolytica]
MKSQDPWRALPAGSRQSDFGTKKSARLSERWNELSKLGMLVNLFT